ncbi:MAG: hypothetical protein ACFFCV_07165 [Promethearchaeota archaeon]
MKERSITYVVVPAMVFGFVLMFSLFYLNWGYFLSTYLTTDGSLLVVLVILLRTGVVFSIGILLFVKWHKQEAQYFSDIRFLFSLFFLGLVFGKLGEIFYYFMYYHFSESLFVITLQVRFLWMILNLSPLFFVTFEILLYYVSENFQSISFLKKDNSKLIKRVLIIIILLIETLLIFMATNVQTISLLYPIVTISSLLLVSWLFYLAHRYKRLKDVKPFILFISFLIYVLNSIIRYALLLVFGTTPIYVLISESSDLIVSFLILYGLT